jgi:preprotein translocase SecE subunit
MMALSLYKRGQGVWSRGIAAAGFAAIGIWGSLQTYRWMGALTSPTAYYAGYWVPGLILAVCLGSALFVTNRASVADFLIETELEMKKVTWPTPREVVVATGVVIVIVLILALFLFLVDRLLWQKFLELIGILPKLVTPPKVTGG